MSFLDDVNSFFEGTTEITSSIFDNSSKVLESLQGFAQSLTNAELATGKKEVAAESKTFAGVDGQMVLIGGAAIVGVIALIALIKS